MIPNNNLSVLPFYKSIEQQNARKWWVYGRVYPLFTPAMFLLPFQILRAHRPPQTYELVNSLTTFAGTIALNNYWYASELATSGYVDVTNLRGLKVEMGVTNGLLQYAFIKAAPVSGEVVQYSEGTYKYQSDSDVKVVIPSDAVYLWVLTSTGSPATDYTPSHITVSENQELTSFKIYRANGDLVGDFVDRINPYIAFKYFTDYDAIIFTGEMPIFFSFENGQYYAELSDGTETWYSEVFTSVNDSEPYLKIEWWDREDFFMDAGVIVYTNPNFRNILYLDSSIAKPEYNFEDEGENRDGYFFPIKQISSKKYRFKFLASEYLLDVMRFIRMADNVQITYNGQTYDVDTFLLTPEWEGNGDVAHVEAEFETATVAKKIGAGYIPVSGGDFNNDFNNDYLIS